MKIISRPQGTASLNQIDHYSDFLIISNWVAIELVPALKKNWSVSIGKGNLNGSNEIRYARFHPP
jgi:hypothetical protein